MFEKKIVWPLETNVVIQTWPGKGSDWLILGHRTFWLIWSRITRMGIPIKTCNFFLWKYHGTSISLVKFIGQLITDGERAGDSLGYLKNIFSFSKLYKKWYQNCNNLQSGDPYLHLGVLNYPNFVTIFVEFWKWKYSF